jgi:hypothetical protein
MMRWMVLAVPVLLAGCVHDVDMGGKCRDGTVDGLVGQSYDAKIHNLIQRRSHSSTVRVVRPGQPVTMDYRIDRITVSLDERGRIVSARCG